ncbi:MAG: hypothetical protein H0U66_10320 [Gemmatimonadaceae bacterium]|nr:hypothetical protein [Gemmatimonadaceae bacterium]
MENYLASDRVAKCARLEIRRERDLAPLTPLRKANRILGIARLDPIAMAARGDAGVGARRSRDCALERDEER